MYFSRGFWSFHDMFLCRDCVHLFSLSQFFQQEQIVGMTLNWKLLRYTRKLGFTGTLTLKIYKLTTPSVP